MKGVPHVACLRTGAILAPLPVLASLEHTVCAVESRKRAASRGGEHSWQGWYVHGTASRGHSSESSTVVAPRAFEQLRKVGLAVKLAWIDTTSQCQH